MKQRNKILFVADDPGGFNTLWPVIKKIETIPSYEVRAILAGTSRQIAQEKNINFIDGDIETDDLTRFLDKEMPDLVVSGTSRNLSIDKKVLLWARENKKKNIYIMDYWSDYKMRFSTPLTEDMVYAPDAVCVIDEIMESAMERDGFDKKNLYITGNPFFDTFKDDKSKAEGEFIVFTSQPFSETYDDDDVRGKLNEVNIFSDYVRALEECGVNLPVSIAFHPREKLRDKFDKIIANSKLKISVTQEKTIDIAKKARIIIGIRTMILFEVAMMGKKVLSYQPGLTKENDVLVSNHLGLSLVAYDYDDMKDKLKKMINGAPLLGDLESARRKYVYSGATDKVIKVINQFLSR